MNEGLRTRNEVMRASGAFQTYPYEVTPLYVDGVLYTTTTLGQIATIDPGTSQTLWSYDPVLYLEGRPAVGGSGEPERLVALALP